MNDLPHTFDETVFTDSARTWLDVDFQEHLVAILHYLSLWEHLNYAFLLDSLGYKFTRTIGPEDIFVENVGLEPERFHAVTRIVEEFLHNINLNSMTHLTIELPAELLFIGAIGEVFLVVSLKKEQIGNGSGNKLSERVANLKTILRLPKR